jgi:hypothetical protein
MAIGFKWAWAIRVSKATIEQLFSKKYRKGLLAYPFSSHFAGSFLGTPGWATAGRLRYNGFRRLGEGK